MVRLNLALPPVVIGSLGVCGRQRPSMVRLKRAGLTVSDPAWLDSNGTEPV
jgi:hypothetical protein